MKYLSNAFSLQMLSFVDEVTIKVKEVEKPASFDGYHSVVGHQDTANVLSVPMNRVSVSLQRGDELLVAQLIGGRLPEGSTTLPEGFSFKYLLVTLD